ncbi:hypothetical protein PIB30_054781 [Stylosanthes scabra]|uniref:Secreted protein n=1 Tax=Stylosanthes scabra TaxID=79078 RepID=A0ABU6RJ00_9FABA|nr:hypothetical protein [Stylosanthes scabra]
MAMRTHRLLWCVRIGFGFGLQAFLCDLLVPRTLFSHFRSELCLLKPETPEHGSQRTFPLGQGKCQSLWTSNMSLTQARGTESPISRQFLSHSTSHSCSPCTSDNKKNRTDVREKLLNEAS